MSGTGWSLVSNNSWLVGQSFSIVERAVVGRAIDCDITIPGTHLSRRHAELVVDGKLLHVRDLGSANGTYLNGSEVTEGHARPGDELKFDVYTFTVVGPERSKDDVDRTVVRLQADDEGTDLATEQHKIWKTKPTSPGNRPEPEAPKQSSLMQAIYAMLIVAVLGMGALAAWYFFYT